MSPSAFFLTSFAGPILTAGLLAWSAWEGRIWLHEHGFGVMPFIFIAVIFGFVVARKVIHTFVRVRCPKCQSTSAYEMDGVPCRFRCQQCWKEF